MAVLLDGRSLSLGSAVSVAEGGSKVSISPSAAKRMSRLRSTLEGKVGRGEVVYGIGTGVGSLAGTRIPAGSMEELQVNLIRSHSAGVGDPMPAEVVRAAMLIRINSLLNGNSAARPVVAERLAAMLNKGVTPYIPRFGSLGASGDLIPSAHMALTLIGEGRAYYGGRLLDSSKALSSSSIEPLSLKAKEGLSLINGTCFTTAFAAVAVSRGKTLLDAGNSAVAMSAEALHACPQSFDARLVGLKRNSGQQHAAKRIRQLLRGSSRLRQEPLPQDPYSLRCVPQVHGAVKEALDFAEGIAVGEMNSVSDNPVIFEDGSVLHGGNFHAQPVAMALDLLALALSYLGVISLARINILLARTPENRKFMARRPGLDSGLMILQYTATALAAENSTLIYPQSAYPANVSDGVEDHASHGVNAGIKALSTADNVSRILAIELICASNRLGGDLSGLSPHSRRICEGVRRVSPLLEEDRPMAEDIAREAEAVVSGRTV